MPGIAVLDIEMPSLTGIEVAVRLRALYGTTIRLIAMSARPEHVALAREGKIFNHALSKPLDISLLLDLLSQKR